MSRDIVAFLGVSDIPAGDGGAVLAGVKAGALRVAFGQQHSGNQLKTLYTGANEYHSEALAMAREQAKEAKKAGDAYGAAALEFAVAYHKAALSWLKVAPAE